MNLRSFLMRHPRPATIRVRGLDGNERSIAVDPKLPWVQVAGYVASLEPEVVEVLDPEGRIIRGTSFAELDENEESEDPIAYAAPAAASQLSHRMQAPTDPQSAQLVLFAQLLADAYRHTTDVAFDKMIGLFEQVNKRYETTEKALDRVHKTVERLLDNRVSRAEEQEELSIAELASAWSGGANMQQQGGPPQHNQPARREPPPPGHHPHNGRSVS